MSFDGTVINGQIVFDPGTILPEGARVRVEVQPTAPPVENKRLRALVDRLAGAAAELGIDCSDLPTDLAQNHDHYLHGLPKQTVQP